MQQRWLLVGAATAGAFVLLAAIGIWAISGSNSRGPGKGSEAVVSAKSAPAKRDAEVPLKGTTGTTSIEPKKQSSKDDAKTVVPKTRPVDVAPGTLVGDWSDADSGRRLWISPSNQRWSVQFFTEDCRQSLADSSSTVFSDGVFHLRMGSINLGLKDPPYPMGVEGELGPTESGELVESIEIRGKRETRTYRRCGPATSITQCVGEWIAKDEGRDYIVTIENKGDKFTATLRVLFEGMELPVRLVQTTRFPTNFFLSLKDEAFLAPGRSKAHGFSLAVSNGTMHSDFNHADPAFPNQMRSRELYFKPYVPGLETPPAPKAKTKTEVPAAEEIAKAIKVVHEKYAKDYAAAKIAVAARLELAGKLLKSGRETDGDASERYCLFSEARDLACQAGSWPSACDALDAVSEFFKVDAPLQRVTALRLVVKSAASKQDLEKTVDICLASIQEQLLAERFEIADQYAAVGTSAAQKVKSTPLQTQFGQLDRDIKAFDSDFKKMTKGRETLRSGDDETAHLDVGRYLALRKGDWVGGLPHLAKAGTATIAAAARKDLDDPKDSSKQQEVGDGWWKLAEKDRDRPMVHAALLARAGHWYRLAATGATEQALADINNKLKTIDETPAPLTASDGAGVEVRRFRGHLGAISALAVAADGKHLYSAGVDGSVRYWDIATAKPLSIHPVGAPILSFDLSPDETHFVTINNQRRMQVWTIEAKPKVINNWPNVVPGVHWLNDKQIHWVDGDNKLRTHSIVTNNGNKNSANVDAVRLFGLSGSGPTLSLGTDVGYANGPRFGTPNPVCAAVSPNASFVAVGSTDKLIRRVALASRQVEGTHAGLAGIPRAVAWSPSSGRIAAGGDDKTVLVWDVKSDKIVTRFSQHLGTITALAFVNEGRQVLSGSEDGTIRMWNVQRETATDR